ncbi:hypothetical protein N7456_011398 [Penicillium angulare]|uniref:Uncharacterized protein n=1 Tax=Penicillium angulare TaxID=116970 RepID=A0A9W9K0N3_9EURO|nr:hypothetical protein N7456_011398 [Penicillium angulare]
MIQRTLITAISYFVVAVSLVRGFKTYPPCPPLIGDVTVNVPNIFPEGAEFAPSNCKFYIGSLNNGSVVEYDPYTSVTEIIDLPGVSHNSDYFVCGVDYSHATGTIYISASARAPWWPSIGGNLHGPNRLFQYSPLTKSILWEANIDPLLAQVEREVGTPYAGFQDSAEDKDGNAYFFGTFGNIIVKVDKTGKASKFYSPDPEKGDRSYGFGGAFVTKENVLVLADALSDGFVLFDLSGPTPSQPTFTTPTGHPANFNDVLECDALIAPPRYRDSVALCSNVLDRDFSQHGIITVYTSPDNWKTSQYVGMIPTDYGQNPDVWSTAQLATSDRVYALSSSLPYDDGKFPETKSTTLVDITDGVDRLVGKFAPVQGFSESGARRDEL